MGEKYKADLQERIDELGGENLRVFINEEGVHPQYYEHLQQTFRDSGVRFVESRAEANFVFEGHCEPATQPGKIVAFFKDERLHFAGMLA